MAGFKPVEALGYSKADIKKLAAKLDRLYIELGQLTRFETFDAEKKAEILTIARNTLNSISMQIMRFADEAVKAKYEAQYNYTAGYLRQYGYDVKNIKDVNVPAVQSGIGDIENYTSSFNDRLYNTFYNRVTLLEKEQIKIDGAVRNIADQSNAGVVRKTMVNSVVDYLEEKFPLGTVSIPYTYLEDGVPVIKTREIALNDYVETLVDDTLSRIETQATLDTMVEAGLELVEIVSEPNCCDICTHYNGQVYSITGESDEYELFTPEKEPIFHPHCRCYAAPYIEGI